ncbi:MAG: FkbM family methyltransferase [Sphingobacteriia bacterium]|nr:FkbM family methyltransferase [Sphingobacteriia bacterium]
MSDTLKAIVAYLPTLRFANQKLWSIRPELPAFSFSECGEDVMILRLFQDHFNIQKGTYIDVGANSPIRYNNTMLLYLEGWRGLVLEPNQRSRKAYQRIRPEDQLIHKVVSAQDDQQLTFFEMEPDLVSTLSRETVLYHQQLGYKLIQEVPVESVSLNTLCKSFKEPVHLISMDTEGHEGEILSTFDFKTYKPWAFCIEKIFTPLEGVIDPFIILEKAGYKPVANTWKNTLFIREDLSV